jgi:large subunit ribosomal protein L24
MKLKKGDTVIISTGKDRGRQGQIERVFVKAGVVLVPGLNVYKKHKKSQGENKPGEILTLSRPYTLSKVALICPKCKQQTRVGFRLEGDKKVRVCRKCDAVIN